MKKTLLLYFVRTLLVSLSIFDGAKIDIFFITGYLARLATFIFCSVIKKTAIIRAFSAFFPAFRAVFPILSTIFPLLPTQNRRAAGR